MGASPHLFNIILDTIMLRVAQGYRSMCRGNLCNIGYRDDICFLTNRYFNLMGKLNDMRKIATNVGFSLSISKTKLMRIKTTNSQLVNIKKGAIETVNYFCYLCDVITTKFCSLKKIWRSTHMFRNTKICQFNVCIKLADFRKLYMIQLFNSFMRIILHAFWPNTFSKFIW